jgi:hypothetical protein
MVTHFFTNSYRNFMFGASCAADPKNAWVEEDMKDAINSRISALEAQLPGMERTDLLNQSSWSSYLCSLLQERNKNAKKEGSEK